MGNKDRTDQKLVEIHHLVVAQDLKKSSNLVCTYIMLQIIVGYTVIYGNKCKFCQQTHRSINQ
jgi:hypothetical protein